MMRRGYFAGVVVVILLPYLASAATIAELQAQLTALMAQVAALQAQTNTVTAAAPVSSGATPPASCPSAPPAGGWRITRNLSRGMKGSDVTQLQQFLISQNLLAADSGTGFFGAMTENAVKQWQCQKMSICTGSPNTNGHGSVGPKTRKSLLNCSANTVGGAVPALVPPAQVGEIRASASGGGGRTTIPQTNVPIVPIVPIVPTVTPPISETPTTLAQYWEGNALWQLERKYTNDRQLPLGWPPGYGEGSQIVVGKDGVWYLFHRHVYNALDTASMNALWGANTEEERKKCSFSGSIIGTDIRKSTDKGVTWSEPRPVVWPAKGSPWECMGGDGGAHYDAASNKWHYLFQCAALNTERTGLGKWNGCLVTFNGVDPVVGPNTLWDVAPTPIAVQSGTILNKLCAIAGSACARLRPILPEVLKPIYDEGTFDIVEKKLVDGVWWWYVTMHGFDNVLGYRGLVKTADFVNWKIGSEAADLPNDFIGSAYTAGDWNETWQGWTDGAGGQLLTEPWNIGTGAARILKEGSYYYEVIEASDKNLVCVPGQNWDIGMLRTNNLANATWEQLPAGNPIFKSSVLAPGLPCGLSYANIFRDSEGTTYLHMHVHSATTGNDGIYLYKLVAK